MKVCRKSRSALPSLSSPSRSLLSSLLRYLFSLSHPLPQPPHPSDATKVQYIYKKKKQKTHTTLHLKLSKLNSHGSRPPLFPSRRHRNQSPTHSSLYRRDLVDVAAASRSVPTPNAATIMHRRRISISIKSKSDILDFLSEFSEKIERSVSIGDIDFRCGELGVLWRGVRVLVMLELMQLK